MPLEIVFQKLIEWTGERPQITIVADANVVRLRDVRELVEVFAVLIEHLNTVVGPIRDVYPAVSIDCNRMRCIELAIAGAGSSPGQQEFSVPVELYDACIAVTIADKKRAIRQPGDVGRPLEVFVVIAGLISHSKGHQKLFAIVGELEDLMMNVVHYPDVVFGIVRADQDRMRPAAILEEMIPLRPGFDELAIGVDNGDAVLEDWRYTCGRQPERARETIEITRQFIRELYFATISDEDFIGRLSENSSRRSPNVSFVGQGLGPTLNCIVGSGAVVSAFLLGKGGGGAQTQADSCNEREEGESHGDLPFQWLGDLERT